MATEKATEEMDVTRRWIVDGLERLCTVLDHVPRVYRDAGRWHFTIHGCWGCYPLRLADASARLDERWKTGHWTESP